MSYLNEKANELFKDKTIFQKSLELEIMNNFKEWKKFSVYAEKTKYNPDTVEWSWKQWRGKLPEVCEIYFSGEYLCDIHENMRRDQAIALINFNLIKVLNNKIYTPI